MKPRKADARELDENRRVAQERIPFFSDAVFAIAMTLGTLPLLETFKEVLTETPESLTKPHVFGLLIAYLVTFGPVASYWLGHHRLFQLTVGFDRSLLEWNLGFLFLISPAGVFATLLATTIPETSDLADSSKWPAPTLALVAFSLWFVALGVVNLGLWWSAGATASPLTRALWVGRTILRRNPRAATGRNFQERHPEHLLLPITFGLFVAFLSLRYFSGWLDGVNVRGIGINELLTCGFIAIVFFGWVFIFFRGAAARVAVPVLGVFSLYLIWLLLRGLSAPATIEPAPPPECQFADEFQQLRDDLASLTNVGRCTDDAHMTMNGDVVQHTLGDKAGMVVQRYIDKRLAYTDGTTTWIAQTDGPIAVRKNDERFCWERDVEAIKPCEPIPTARES